MNKGYLGYFKLQFFHFKIILSYLIEFLFIQTNFIYLFTFLSYSFNLIFMFNYYNFIFKNSDFTHLIEFVDQKICINDYLLTILKLKFILIRIY
jgi:hypothetical protein